MFLPLLPCRVQQPEARAEWSLVLTMALAVAPPQQAVTAHQPKGATHPPLMAWSKFQDEVSPRYQTAAGRNMTLASSRNRTRRMAQESRRIHHSETGTSGQTSILSHLCLERAPSRHYAASPYRIPFQAGSDQTGEGRRSIHARLSLLGASGARFDEPTTAQSHRAAPMLLIFRR